MIYPLEGVFFIVIDSLPYPNILDYALFCEIESRLCNDWKV